MNSNTDKLKFLKNNLYSIFGNIIKEIILFGSQAKGNASEFSDYDLLVYLSVDYDWKFKDKIRDIVCDFEIENEIIIDLHFISDTEIDTIRWNNPLINNAIKEGIYL